VRALSTHLQHLAGVAKQSMAFVGRPRITSGSIEEPDPKLDFEISKRLTYHRVRASQLAPRGGEASLLDRCNESA
jgi:hypothetical protein